MPNSSFGRSQKQSTVKASGEVTSAKASGEVTHEAMGAVAEALEKVLQGFEWAVLEANAVALLEALRGVVGV